MRYPDARIMKNTRRWQRRISIWYYIQEARFAAEDFHEKLQIPFIELRRLYQIDKITKQYQALGKVLGIPFEDHEAAEQALDSENA